MKTPETRKKSFFPKQNLGGYHLKFKELGLAPELLSAVERAGFEEATPIQSETIPLALAEKT